MTEAGAVAPVSVPPLTHATTLDSRGGQLCDLPPGSPLPPASGPEDMSCLWCRAILDAVNADPAAEVVPVVAGETVRSYPRALADLMEKATAEDDAVQMRGLWERLIADHGYTDALQLWESAHREINARAKGRPRGDAGAEDEWQPGDRSPEAVAKALARFYRAFGLGEDDVLSGWTNHGSSAYRADIEVHLGSAAAERAEEIGRALQATHTTKAVPSNRYDREQRRAPRQEFYEAEWQGYRVLVISYSYVPHDYSIDAAEASEASHVEASHVEVDG